MANKTPDSSSVGSVRKPSAAQSEAQPTARSAPPKEAQKQAQKPQTDSHKSDETSFGNIKKLKKESERNNDKLFSLKPATQAIDQMKSAAIDKLSPQRPTLPMPQSKPSDPIPKKAGIWVAQQLTTFNNTVGQAANGGIRGVNDAALSTATGTLKLGVSALDSSFNAHQKVWTPNGRQALASDVKLMAAQTEKLSQKLTQDPVGMLKDGGQKAVESVSRLAASLVQPTVSLWNSKEGNVIANRSQAVTKAGLDVLGLVQGVKEVGKLFKSAPTAVQTAIPKATLEDINPSQAIEKIKSGSLSATDAKSKLSELNELLKENKGYWRSKPDVRQLHYELNIRANDVSLNRTIPDLNTAASKPAVTATALSNPNTTAVAAAAPNATANLSKAASSVILPSAPATVNSAAAKKPEPADAKAQAAAIVAKANRQAAQAGQVTALNSIMKTPGLSSQKTVPVVASHMDDLRSGGEELRPPQDPEILRETSKEPNKDKKTIDPTLKVLIQNPENFSTFSKLLPALRKGYQNLKSAIDPDSLNIPASLLAQPALPPADGADRLKPSSQLGSSNPATPVDPNARKVPTSANAWETWTRFSQYKRAAMRAMQQKDVGANVPATSFSQHHEAAMRAIQQKDVGANVPAPSTNHTPSFRDKKLIPNTQLPVRALRPTPTRAAPTQVVANSTAFSLEQLAKHRYKTTPAGQAGIPEKWMPDLAQLWYAKKPPKPIRDIPLERHIAAPDQYLVQPIKRTESELEKTLKKQINQSATPAIRNIQNRKLISKKGQGIAFFHTSPERSGKIIGRHPQKEIPHHEYRAIRIQKPTEAQQKTVQKIEQRLALAPEFESRVNRLAVAANIHHDQAKSLMITAQETGITLEVRPSNSALPDIPLYKDAEARRKGDLLFAPKPAAIKQKSLKVDDALYHPVIEENFNKLKERGLIPAEVPSPVGGIAFFYTSPESLEKLVKKYPEREVFLRKNTAVRNQEYEQAQKDFVQDPDKYPNVKIIDGFAFYRDSPYSRYKYVAPDVDMFRYTAQRRFLNLGGFKSQRAELERISGGQPIGGPLKTNIAAYQTIQNRLDQSAVATQHGPVNAWKTVKNLHMPTRQEMKQLSAKYHMMVSGSNDLREFLNERATIIFKRAIDITRDLSQFLKGKSDITYESNRRFLNHTATIEFEKMVRGGSSDKDLREFLSREAQAPIHNPDPIVTVYPNYTSKIGQSHYGFVE
jgi:hypothetical protein